MKCVISGCIKNGSRFIKPVFANIKQIMAIFEETKIIVSYDESQDNTMEELLKQQQELSNMIILTNPNPQTRIRTLNIAIARNRILDYIQENYQHYDYFIMMDLDNVCSPKINVEVLKQNLLRTDWDGLSFNNDSYYDTWALSIDFLIYSCWHWTTKNYTSVEVEEKMREYVINKINNTKITDLVECMSAFNGFAIYKINKFINCRYKCVIDVSYFNIDLLKTASQYLNAMPLKIAKHYNNFDCEHRLFHFDAIKNNNAKIRISPMKLFDKILWS